MSTLIWNRYGAVLVTAQHNGTTYEILRRSASGYELDANNNTPTSWHQTLAEAKREAERLVTREG